MNRHRSSFRSARVSARLGLSLSMLFRVPKASERPMLRCIISLVMAWPLLLTRGRGDISTMSGLLLTRSGFAGVQRWSACWMGDNHSWWEHLEMAMPQLMNMGLSGVPFVGTDIGGFSGNASGELFTRWMQFGVLSPFCRAHSEIRTERHEPWIFGPRVEAICREFLQLRYRLFPISTHSSGKRRGVASPYCDLCS